jgi:hypothetical protein
LDAGEAPARFPVAQGAGWDARPPGPNRPGQAGGTKARVGCFPGAGPPAPTRQGLVNERGRHSCRGEGVESPAAGVGSGREREQPPAGFGDSDRLRPASAILRGRTREGAARGAGGASATPFVTWLDAQRGSGDTWGGKADDTALRGGPAGRIEPSAVRAVGGGNASSDFALAACLKQRARRARSVISATAALMSSGTRSKRTCSSSKRSSRRVSSLPSWRHSSATSETM